MEDVKLLKKLPLFKEFKTTELMNVAMVARHELYRAGEVIFREASEGDALYVIKSGRARVTKCDSSDREFVLAYLENISARSRWLTAPPARPRYTPTPTPRS